MLSGVVSSQFGNYMATYAIQALKLPPAVAQGSVLMAGLLTFACALFAGCCATATAARSLMIAAARRR